MVGLCSISGDLGIDDLNRMSLYWQYSVFLPFLVWCCIFIYFVDVALLVLVVSFSGLAADLCVLIIFCTRFVQHQELEASAARKGNGIACLATRLLNGGSAIWYLHHFPSTTLIPVVYDIRLLFVSVLCTFCWYCSHWKMFDFCCLFVYLYAFGFCWTHVICVDSMLI